VEGKNPPCIFTSFCDKSPLWHRETGTTTPQIRIEEEKGERKEWGKLVADKREREREIERERICKPPFNS